MGTAGPNAQHPHPGCPQLMSSEGLDQLVAVACESGETSAGDQPAGSRARAIAGAGGATSRGRWYLGLLACRRSSKVQSPGIVLTAFCKTFVCRLKCIWLLHVHFDHQQFWLPVVVGTAGGMVTLPASTRHSLGAPHASHLAFPPMLRLLNPAQVKPGPRRRRRRCQRAWRVLLRSVCLRWMPLPACRT